MNQHLFSVSGDEVRQNRPVGLMTSVLPVMGSVVYLHRQVDDFFPGSIGGFTVPGHHGIASWVLMQTGAIDGEGGQFGKYRK